MYYKSQIFHAEIMVTELLISTFIGITRFHEIQSPLAMQTRELLCATVYISNLFYQFLGNTKPIAMETNGP